MTPNRRQSALPLILSALALVLASCSGGSSDSTESSPSTDGATTSAALDVGSEVTTTIAAPAVTEVQTTEAQESAPPVTDAPIELSALPAPGGGQACVGSREGVSCLQDNGEWIVHDESTGLANNFVLAIDVCESGELVVGNSSGLDMFDGTRWLEVVEPFEFGSADHLQCVAPDDIWAGGFDEVAHWDGAAWELFDSATFNEGILDDLELDPNGLPWVGVSTGIFAYDGTSWTTYDESNSFENHSVDDLAFAPDGRLEAVLLLSRATFADGVWTESDYDGVARAIAATNDATWIGTFNRGLDLIVGGTTATLDRSSGEMPSDKIESMTVDAAGRVWVGTGFGLVVLEDNKVVQTFHMNNSGIHDDLVRNISVQGAGPASLGSPVEAPTSTFSGIITDGANPVPEAQVEICVLPLLDSFDGETPCADQPLVYSATTDAAGAFVIPDVLRARYVFVVNPGSGWIQATGQFGISSERVLIDTDFDLGEFAAVPSDG